MPQRNIKGLAGLAAQRAVEGTKSFAKRTATIAKSIPSKWNKYATTNRTINGQEVVSMGFPDLEYGVKKIGQGIGKGIGRLAYGKIESTPKSVKPNTKKKK